MWLIKTESLDLEYFHDASHVRYAILSHTWEDEEITFQDMKSKRKMHGKKGYKKVESCCIQAREDGFKYAWVDTCCIDKTSSAELSEAINSMFNWYQKSTVCYALLSNIPTAAPNTMSDSSLEDAFKASRWFTRGWTLQELLAPSHVEFYAADWSRIGTKAHLLEQIHEITRISTSALQSGQLSRFNAAEKMSWAAQRQTTRIEDKAYCLLGLFEVNMPLLYGEGDRAFLRLQEHIIQNVEDYTLFAWPGRDYNKINDANIPYQTSADLTDIGDNTTSIFAREPADFKRLGLEVWRYSDLFPISQDGIDASLLPRDQRSEAYNKIEYGTDPPAVTARGVRLSLPLIHLTHKKYLACLWTALKHSPSEWICVPLIQDDYQPNRFARDAVDDIHLVDSFAGLAFTRCQIYVERLNINKPRKHNDDNLTNSDLMDHMLSLVAAPEPANGPEVINEAMNTASTKAISLSTRFYGPCSLTTIHIMLEYIKAALEKDCVARAEEIALELIDRIGDILAAEARSWILLGCQAASLFKAHLTHIAERIFTKMFAICERHVGKNDRDPNNKVGTISTSGAFLVRVMRAQYFLRWEPHQADIQYAEDVLWDFDKRWLADRPSMDAYPQQHGIWLEHTALALLARFDGSILDVQNLLESILYLLIRLKGNASPLAIPIILLLGFVLKRDPDRTKLWRYQQTLADRLGSKQQIVDGRWKAIVAAAKARISDEEIDKPTSIKHNNAVALTTRFREDEY